MKFKYLAIGVISASLLYSCGGSTESTETVAAEVTGETDTLAVDAGASTVAWSGGTRGASVYGHNGVIDIKEGSLVVEGSKVVGGSITIDMNTIQPLDSGYSEEHPKEQLIGHLTTGDFFLVEEFPTASFTIKSANTDGTITGDLTIRGNTNEEKVTDVVVEETEDGVKASGKLVFDRQKYGVSWAHFLKDVVLADEIELEITLVAKK